MNPALLGVLAAGGVVIATQEDARAPVVPKPKTGTVRYAADIRTTKVALDPGRLTASPLVHAPTATTSDGLTAEARAAIKADLQRQFDTMSGAAKKAACEKLKDQFADDSSVQALNCADATFQQLVTVVGAAIGTAVCGPACGALGVIAAQYFGEDINEMWNDFQSAIGGDGDVCTGTAFLLGFDGEASCKAWRAAGHSWKDWAAQTDAQKTAWNKAH